MRWLPVILSLVVAGCGTSSSPPPALPRPTEEPPLVSPTPAPEAVRFDPQDLSQVADVYRRAKAGDNSVWADHGLVNSRGLPDATEMERYYQAVQAYSADPQRWTRFLAEVEKLERAGTKGGDP